MNSKQRRESILTLLSEAETPLTATELASQCSVCRQIIVGDIALLRAEGHPIDATSRGYVIQRESKGLIRRVAVRHNASQLRSELYTMVDYGCEVIDVIVEHPVYGQLTGSLSLSSRFDVDRFIDRCEKTEALPLSFLTEGIHLHTLSCPDEQTFERLKRSLDSLGVLLSDSSN